FDDMCSVLYVCLSFIFLFSFFFFFSSRRRHTRSKRDWSSDVCSSDLPLSSSWETALVLGRFRGTSLRRKRVSYCFWAKPPTHGAGGRKFESRRLDPLEPSTLSRETTPSRLAMPMRRRGGGRVRRFSAGLSGAPCEDRRAG